MLDLNQASLPAEPYSKIIIRRFWVRHGGFGEASKGSDLACRMVSAGSLAGRIPIFLALQRYRGRNNVGRLRDSGFPRLCGTCRPASASRCLWISAWWSWLRPARLFASACDRAHLRHFADDCRNGGGDGGWRRATVCADRKPRSLHRRGPLPVRMVAAIECAREADQRQYSCGLQGRRRLNHRDD